MKLIKIYGSISKIKLLKRLIYNYEYKINIGDRVSIPYTIFLDTINYTL